MMRRSIGEYSEAWLAGTVQAEAKARAGGKCETCGRVKKAMSCHHINMNRADDRPDNILYLCNKCHLECHLVDWIPGEVLPLRWWKNPPRWITARNLPFQINRQLLLWSDSDG